MRVHADIYIFFRVHISIHRYMHLHLCVHVYISMHVGLYAYMYEWKYEWKDVCTYTFMYVSMHRCIYVGSFLGATTLSLHSCAVHASNCILITAVVHDVLGPGIPGKM